MAIRATLAVSAWCLFAAGATAQDLKFLNRGRPLADAHNCYPYNGKWTDRISRALGTGFPVAIEQDLAWRVDPATGKGSVVVSHDAQTNGSEPLLRDHFFEVVRPAMEKALREPRPSEWPLVVLHFDFKDNRPELLRAVWNLLGEYENWMVTAPKSADPDRLEEFSRKPLLVLTEDADEQEQVFFRDVPVGARLRLFGSAHTKPVAGKTQEERIHNVAAASPAQLLSAHPTNYRRWWNNSWFEVEEGGQNRAGDWTAADDRRLRALVDHAHALGFWIRFYTLDGFTPQENKGWGESYNFGSREAAVARWKAAVSAGVDLIASDQYEDLARVVSAGR